jgi:hypothetical protein
VLLQNELKQSKKTVDLLKTLKKGIFRDLIEFIFRTFPDVESLWDVKYQSQQHTG